jgi:hypothetical protein
MNSSGIQSHRPAPKRLSLEQKIRLLARRYRARERRRAGKTTNEKVPFRPWWTVLAGALAQLAMAAVSLNAFAGPVTATFERANQAYASGQFVEAVRGYEEVIAQRGFSAPVLFNLANAFQRTGEQGRAILNYERAQWLAPRDSAIATNLLLARRKAGCATMEQSNLEKAARMLRLDTLAWVGSAALVLMCAGFLGGRLLPSSLRTGAHVLMGAAAGVLALVLVTFVWRWSDLDRAVVLAANAPARIAPAEAAGVSFSLAAGEIVHARRLHGGFMLVRTRDGRFGWMNRHQVARIIVSAREASSATPIQASASFAPNS